MFCIWERLQQHFIGVLILLFPQSFYSEYCERACVMFASIPEFWSLYSETEINRKGVEWLRLLNEIIGDFDDVRKCSNPNHFEECLFLLVVGIEYVRYCRLGNCHL